MNTNPLELTTVYRDEDYFYHLTGTQFYKQIIDEELEATASMVTADSIREQKFIVRNTANNFEESTESEHELGDAIKWEDASLLEKIQQFMSPLYAERLEGHS